MKNLITKSEAKEMFKDYHQQDIIGCKCGIGEIIDQLYNSFADNLDCEEICKCENDLTTKNQELKEKLLS